MEPTVSVVPYRTGESGFRLCVKKGDLVVLKVTGTVSFAAEALEEHPANHRV